MAQARARRHFLGPCGACRSPRWTWLAVMDLRDELPNAMANERVLRPQGNVRLGDLEAEGGTAIRPRGSRAIQYRKKGHHSWEPEEVEQFEGKFPIGTRARLAMTLMLYTACRREDVIRLGPKNIVNGRLRFTQAKNEHRAPVGPWTSPSTPTLPPSSRPRRSASRRSSSRARQALHPDRIRSSVSRMVQGRRPAALLTPRPSQSVRGPARRARRDQPRDHGDHRPPDPQGGQRYTRAAQRKVMADEAMGRF